MPPTSGKPSNNNHVFIYISWFWGFTEISQVVLNLFYAASRNYQEHFFTYLFSNVCSLWAETPAGAVARTPTDNYFYIKSGSYEKLDKSYLLMWKLCSCVPMGMSPLCSFKCNIILNSLLSSQVKIHPFFNFSFPGWCSHQVDSLSLIIHGLSLFTSLTYEKTFIQKFYLN